MSYISYHNIPYHIVYHFLSYHISYRIVYHINNCANIGYVPRIWPVICSSSKIRFRNTSEFLTVYHRASDALRRQLLCTWTAFAFRHKLHNVSQTTSKQSAVNFNIKHTNFWDNLVFWHKTYCNINGLDIRSSVVTAAISCCIRNCYQLWHLLL